MQSQLFNTIMIVILLLLTVFFLLNALYFQKVYFEGNEKVSKSTAYNTGVMNLIACILCSLTLIYFIYSSATNKAYTTYQNSTPLYQYDKSNVSPNKKYEVITKSLVTGQPIPK